MEGYAVRLYCIATKFATFETSDVRPASALSNPGPAHHLVVP
jgi:hypothetical protein